MAGKLLESCKQRLEQLFKEYYTNFFLTEWILQRSRSFICKFVIDMLWVVEGFLVLPSFSFLLHFMLLFCWISVFLRQSFSKFCRLPLVKCIFLHWFSCTFWFLDFWNSLSRPCHFALPLTIPLCISNRDTAPCENVELVNAAMWILRIDCNSSCGQA